MNIVDGKVVDVNGQVAEQAQQVQTQVVNTAPTQQPVVGIQSAQNTQAMFTQEQLNSIISGRINPLNQKIQELSSQLAQAQQLSQSYLTELTGFKNRDIAIKAGVPAQFVDFAVFEASKLAVNGKSFNDAMKEYVALNGSIFGVSQMNNQVDGAVSPTAQLTTQGVASSAQVAQTQQVSTVGNDGVVSFTNQNTVNNQVGNTGATNNAQKPDGVSFPQTGVQYGATSVQTAGNIAGVNNVDSEVDAFLKARGLRK